MAKGAVAEEKQGDCSQWLCKGPSSKGDLCSFKHDENKREKAKGRNPTRSPFRDPNRSSEGDGKGARFHGPQGISPSEKETSQLAASSRRENARSLPVIMGIFLSAPKYKTKERCRFGEKCSNVHKGEGNGQGKEAERRLKKQTKQQPLWWETLNTREVGREKQNLYMNQRMGLQT